MSVSHTIEWLRSTGRRLCELAEQIEGTLAELWGRGHPAPSSSEPEGKRRYERPLREAIAAVLAGAEKPLTAADITQAIRKTFPRLDRPSLPSQVYHVLYKFTEVFEPSHGDDRRTYWRLHSWRKRPGTDIGLESFPAQSYEARVRANGQG